MSGNHFLRHLWAWRTILILFLTPIVLLPLPLVLNAKEADCAYVVLLMAIFWITESLPVGVTALLPVVCFPLMEILSSDEVASQYMNDINMLFMGGLIMAIAIEHWNLHKRVALRVLMLVGSEPRWIMLGMMTSTWFLSMWISNTATTAMMVPIAEAVLVQLKGSNPLKRKLSVIQEKETTQAVDSQETKGRKQSQISTISSGKSPSSTLDMQLTVSVPPADNDLGQTSTDDVSPADSDQDEDHHFKKLCKGMSLSICYSSNSGGIASLTGTSPNLILKGNADKLYRNHGLSSPVTFASWLGLGFPLSFILLIVCWIWLQIAFVGFRRKTDKEDAKDKSRRIKESFQEEYRKLGPLVFGQVVIIVLFLTLLVLWITRDLGGVAGWGQLFKPPVNDGAVAIFISLLLFALPSTLPCLKSYSDPAHPSKWEETASDTNSVKGGPLEIQPLLHWKVVHEKMPWHLFLLLGGGYAMSKGCEKSGLSLWIGQELQFLSHWNKYGVLFIICYVTAAATEVMSNAAMATLLMPIMSQLALHTNVHPLYYMFPTALACSFAFMLPVATAPNAIVFAYGRVRVVDMASAGLVMNILAVPILVGVTATIGNAIFDFSNVPPQLFNFNSSAVTSTM